MKVAGNGEGRNEKILNRLAFRQLLAKLDRLGGKRFVGQCLGCFFKRANGFDFAPIGADTTFVCRTEQLAGYSAETDHLTGPF